MHNRVLVRDAPVWMIGRNDQLRILAAHLAHHNRLVRWDSFWRHDGIGFLTPRPGGWNHIFPMFPADISCPILWESSHKSFTFPRETSIPICLCRGWRGSICPMPASSTVREITAFPPCKLPVHMA